MTEENQENPEQNEQDWESPPLPEEIQPEVKEEPQMSEFATIGNVFIEPGRTFEDLRRKPRFIIAFVIIAVLSVGFLFAFQAKVGEESIRRFVAQQQEKSPQMQGASEAQKEQALNVAMTIQKISTYAFPVVLGIIFLLGGLFYWIGTKAMGGNARFTHGLSVFIYSALPPTVVSQIANFIILFLKAPEEIDIASSQRGLVKANPTMFFDGKETPVLTTLISTLDVFVIWGLVLAAIGLQKVARISAGAAWGVVLILTLLGIALRVLGAFMNGIPN